MSSTTQPIVANGIYQGDCLELLERIDRHSVALSVWSPPYHVGKSYETGQTYEQWRELISGAIAAHSAVLKPGGFCVVNIADILVFPDPEMPRLQALTLGRQRKSPTREEVIAAADANPDLNRYQLARLLECSEQTIDRRLHGNNIRGGKYTPQTRVHLVGSFIEEAGRRAGLYLYDRRVWVKDPAWENSRWHSLSYRSIDEFEHLFFLWKPGVTKVDRDRLEEGSWAEWGSRGVWRIPSVRANKLHDAMFPIELPRRVIRLLTDPDDIVLDPFVGSGTSVLAAIELDRRYIGMDSDAKYCALAEANIRTWRARKSVTQDTIWPDVAQLQQ